MIPNPIATRSVALQPRMTLVLLSWNDDAGFFSGGITYWSVFPAGNQYLSAIDTAGCAVEH